MIKSSYGRGFIFWPSQLFLPILSMYILTLTDPFKRCNYTDFLFLKVSSCSAWGKTNSELDKKTSNYRDRTYKKVLPRLVLVKRVLKNGSREQTSGRR